MQACPKPRDWAFPCERHLQKTRQHQPATLDKFVIRLRPAGYFRTASVNEDGNVIGNVCHLFNDGTSNKLILEHELTDADNTDWYAIRTLLNFEEHKKTGYSIWSVDGDSGQRWKGHPRMERRV